QRRQLRALQDLRHQGPVRDHHLGHSGGWLRAELPEPVGAASACSWSAPLRSVQPAISLAIVPMPWPNAAATIAVSVPDAGTACTKVRDATTARSPACTSLAFTSMVAAGVAPPA